MTEEQPVSLRATDVLQRVEPGVMTCNYFVALGKKSGSEKLDPMPGMRRMLADILLTYGFEEESAVDASSALLTRALRDFGGACEITADHIAGMVVGILLSRNMAVSATSRVLDCLQQLEGGS